MGPKVPTGDILCGRTKLGKQLPHAPPSPGRLVCGRASHPLVAYAFPHSTITASGPGFLTHFTVQSELVKEKKLSAGSNGNAMPCMS